MSKPVVDQASGYARQLSGMYDYDSLTDYGYEIADSIELWFSKHAGMYSPSRIARGIGHETVETRHVLTWMESHVLVAADGNGAWRKYGAR